ncbi:hypothetical protein L195_g062751, partial [Trifolium pratense]
RLPLGNIVLTSHKLLESFVRGSFDSGDFCVAIVSLLEMVLLCCKQRRQKAASPGQELRLTNELF